MLTLAGAGSSGAFTLGAAGSTGALAGAVGMLYLFVIAVALLAPWINRYAARLLTPVLPRLWGVSGYLAAANLRANAQGMATVLTALVLSVGLGGSVWFLQTNLERQTVAQSGAGTLAERVLAAPGGLPADAAGEVRELPGVRAATGVRRTQVVVRSLDGIEPVTRAGGRPGRPHSTHGPRRARGRPGRPGAGTVALSATQASASGLARRRPGGPLAGRRHPCHAGVVAIYGRGLGFGDVTLAAGTVAGHTAEVTDDEILVRAGPDADAALAAWSAGHPGAEVRRRRHPYPPDRHRPGPRRLAEPAADRRAGGLRGAGRGHHDGDGGAGPPPRVGVAATGRGHPPSGPADGPRRTGRAARQRGADRRDDRGADPGRDRQRD